MYINRFRFNFSSYRKVGSKVVSWKCAGLSSLQVDSQNNVFNAAQDNNPTFAGPGVTLIKAMRPWRDC